nr:MAG TPA: hypothetical protein [Caudoviricetes sp.]DAI42803.1 MAG TPA: hypothetical protein [Caudoviricetes sp.]
MAGKISGGAAAPPFCVKQERSFIYEQSAFVCL